MVSENVNGVHKVFTNDPIYFKSLVNNEVEIETVHERSPHKGILYTIDPVSETVVLLNPTDDGIKVDIIMAFNVKSIKIIQSSNIPKIPDNLFKEGWTKFHSEEEVEKKRLQLKEWLLKNSIPIEESDKCLKLADVLTIQPPYGPEQCMSSNEIVLGKIQTLIKSMPTS